jgi:hypothetical protein
MNKDVLKSIWAVLAGFILVVAFSIATDILLTKTGAMKQPFDLNSTFFILLVVAYRCVYGVAGSFLTARLAPNRPMKHSIIGGVIGLIIATVGAIAMWHQPPHWYPIALIITTLPCAWLGGWAFIRSQLT